MLQWWGQYMKGYIENCIIKYCTPCSRFLIFILCHTEREREREKENSSQKLYFSNLYANEPLLYIKVIFLMQFFVLFILHPHSWDLNLRNKIFSDMLSFILFQTLSFLNLYTVVLCCLQYYAVYVDCIGQNT